MPIEESNSLQLIKPIFIEESFTAPFMSRKFQSEIESATEWLKAQNISDNLFGLPSGTKVQAVLVDFLEESINLNRKLEKKYQTFAVQDYQTYSNHLQNEINISDAVNGCFVFNLDNANDFFNKCCFMISPYFPHYEKVFGRTLNEEELKFCKLIHFYLDKWYKAEWYFVYDEFVLKKPVFQKERFKEPTCNEALCNEIYRAFNLFKINVHDDKLNSDLEVIFSELIAINRELIKTISLDKSANKYANFVFSSESYINLPPEIQLNEHTYANSPFISKHNELVIGFTTRRIEAHVSRLFKQGEESTAEKGWLLSKFIFEHLRVNQELTENNM